MKYLRALIAILLLTLKFNIVLSSLTFPIAESEVYKEEQEINNKIEYFINLAQTYRFSKKFAEAEILFNEALKESSNAEDQKNLKLKMADVYFWWAEDLRIKKHDRANAIKYYEMAYAIDNIYRSRDAAIDLNNIGTVYSEFIQTDKALDYYKKALLISQSVGDRETAATALDNMGKLYHIIGHTYHALKYFEKSLSIRQEIGDRQGELIVLHDIGFSYDTIGMKYKALDYYDKALTISQEIEDRSGEAATINNIGYVYDILGQKNKALKYYKKALQITRSERIYDAEGTVLNNIGHVYNAFDQKYKALFYFKKALKIALLAENYIGITSAYNNLGLVYSALGQKKKALDYFEKSLQTCQFIGESTREVAILNNIGLLYSDLDQKQKGLGIFYGKQAINRFQYLRENNDNLETAAKLKYLKSKADTYRSTSSQLIFAGRLGEAQQVIDILKDEEYFSYVLLNRSAYTPRYSPIEYTGFERKWSDRQNMILAKISSINKSIFELSCNPNKTIEEQKKQEALKIDLEKFQKEYHDFQVQMEKEFEKHEGEKDTDIDALAKQSSALIEYLKFLDRDNNGKTAALHYLVSNGQISVIITTPTAQAVKQSDPFDEKEFNKMIFDYRDLIEKLALLSKSTDSTSISASKIDEFDNQKRDIETKLYNLTFKPVDEYLKKYSAINLLVSLDGVLRYIPLGSLWDGQHYLIQEYRFVLLTPSSLKHMDENPVIENKILGMGASKGGNGFKPLLHAGQEIRTIVNDPAKHYTGLINGNALIDNDFTRETMFSKLKTSSYPLVHIASHFQFSPGDETKNQLLLGDGTTISLSEIRNEGKLFDKVKLLVLSACQTGMGGNGEEIDGFGEMAQQLGAGSVIASLWAVDDKSTKELMVKFYSLLKEGNTTSKIEALRLAQLQLAGLDDLINKTTAAPAKSSEEKFAYSNPYYWAPFIMMGNGR